METLHDLRTRGAESEGEPAAAHEVEAGRGLGDAGRRA